MEGSCELGRRQSVKSVDPAFVIETIRLRLADHQNSYSRLFVYFVMSFSRSRM